MVFIMMISKCLEGQDVQFLAFFLEGGGGGGGGGLVLLFVPLCFTSAPSCKQIK